MANLVTVTKASRLILKLGGIGAGLILLIYIFVQGGTLFRNIFFPKPPPVPLQGLGKLPHIKFPTPGTTGIQFRVNTIDGKLPILPDRVNVYKLISHVPNLLALEKAKQTVDSANFVDNQTKITDTLYQWTQSRTGVILRYDIVTKNFTITSNYLTNPFLASDSLMPSEDQIKSDVMGFLQTMQANTQNIDREKTKVKYLQYNNGVLVAAQNLGSAKYARVTLVQQSVDDIPIIYDTPNDSILTFVVAYPKNNFQVLEGQFYNHEPDLTQKSDYPIKTATQALEDLKKGNAYMINPQNLTSVDITNVELKYYLNRESKDFLMPVIVFSGINFTAYVEAIPALSLEN
jgi:hypothetical protein